MPRHYAIGINVQPYRVYFSGVKTMTVVFVRPFQTVPSINVTLEDSSTSPAWKTAVTQNGCTIKFQTSYTGWVAVQAME